MLQQKLIFKKESREKISILIQRMDKGKVKVGSKDTIERILQD